MLPYFLTFKYLRRAVYIEAVLHDKGVSHLKKRKDQLVGTCPVHGCTTRMPLWQIFQKTSGIALPNAILEAMLSNLCEKWMAKLIMRPLNIAHPYGMLYRQRQYAKNR